MDSVSNIEGNKIPVLLYTLCWLVVHRGNSSVRHLYISKENFITLHWFDMNFHYPSFTPTLPKKDDSKIKKIIILIKNSQHLCSLKGLT